jgi:hypothetical protein
LALALGGQALYRKRRPKAEKSSYTIQRSNAEVRKMEISSYERIKGSPSFLACPPKERLYA